MKAIVIRQHGGPEVLVLEEIATPAVGPNDILVQVKACALNHLDVWLRQGLPGVKLPLPRIAGNDIAGIVAEVGTEVRHVQVGQEVMLNPGTSCGRCEACLSGADNLCREYRILGYLRDGGYAEYVVAPATNAIPKPANLSWAEAAAVPLTFLTAWHMLVTRAGIQAGEKVLVHAGGSGVGVAAIQIARLFGASVATTVGSDAKIESAKALGADVVINYNREDFVSVVRDWTGKRGVEVVIEHTGPVTWDGSIRSLATNGRLVTCGSTSGPTATMDFRFLFSKHLNILGSYMGSKAELLRLMPLVAEGRLRPVVDRTFPLAEAAQAHERMESRANFGKIVLLP